MIFIKFSMEIFNKILTEDEIFEKFKIEKSRLIQMIKTHLLKENTNSDKAPNM